VQKKNHKIENQENINPNAIIVEAQVKNYFNVNLEKS